MKLPDPVVLSGNPVIVEKTSNNMYSEPGRKSQLYLTFAQGGVVLGNSNLQLSFAGIGINIVFKANPNAWLFEFPTTNSINATWVNNFFNFLKSMPDLSLNYYLTKISDYVIVLESDQKHADYTIAPATNIAALTFTNTPAITPVKRPGFRIHCIASTAAGSYIGHEVIVPNSAGKATFDMSDYLWTQIANQRSAVQGFNWPAKTLKIFAHASHSVDYNLLLSEEWEGKVRPGSHHTGYTALMGGQSNLKISDGGSFYSEHIQQGKFLTQAPRVKTTSPKAPERLYYFNTATRTIVLKASKIYSDGTSATVTIGSLSAVAGRVYELDCSFSNFAQGELQTEAYNIWLENSGSTVISEIFTFQVDHRYYDNEQHFIFRNSLGGYDCLRTTGRNLRSLEIDRETFENEDKMRSMLENIAETNYVANTGSITADTMRWLDDLMLSTEAYWLNFFRPLAIVINNKKKETVDDIQRRFNLTFEFSLANLESFYTTPQQTGVTQPNTRTDA